MRIERCHGDARPCNAEKILEPALRQFQCDLNVFPGQIARHSSERDVPRDRHHPQFGAHEHHPALGRAAELGQKLRMPGIIVPGVDQNAFADGSGRDRVNDFRERQFGRHANIAKRTVAALFGGPAWP